MKNQFLKNLTKLFNPNSIAILGASRDEKKIGHIILKNIVNSGFNGKIFPLNPHIANLNGLDCYAAYKDLPQIPDLAILAVPAEIAVTLLESITKKGTKNIVVLSSGFKEAGEQGEKLENSLCAAAKKHQLNILGPNCLGFLNVPAHLNATFSQAGSVKGNLRFISQSGALASGIFDWARQHQVGFGEFVTLGNKAVLNENDILRYWLSQPKKRLVENGLSAYQPIGMYLESVSAGKDFLDLVAQISINNPVFILKPGKSKQAKQAIRSHTGSLAGDGAVQEAAFKEAGAIRCEGTEDMFDLARIFSWENAPKGPKVAIISNAGGPAVISVDALEKEGLQLANFSPATRKKLQRILPSAASVLNPVDILGDALADRYDQAISQVLSDKNVNALIIILTPQIITEVEATAEVIGKLAFKYRKPVICSFMGGNLVDKGEELLDRYKIPSFRFPERAVKALAGMWEWRLRVESKKLKVESKRIKPLAKKTVGKINKIIKFAQNKERKVLSSLEANEILRLGGIKIAPTAKVKNLTEAQKFARAQNWPVVLKISSPSLLHKTEGGGVILNIDNQIKLEQAWEKISQTASKLPDKSLTAIQIQKQAASGLEVIAGVKYDKDFGQALMFGAGGILVELLADTQFKFLPINTKEAERLVKSAKIYPLLKGYRKQKSYAIKEIIEMIVSLGRLAQAAPFAEIELNPIIVTTTEALAVDARIILS